jgi:cytochrome P450
MLPAFHKKRIEAYRDAMVAITGDELAHWRPGEAVDVAEEMHGLTLRIVTKTLFGEDGGRAARGIGHDMFDALSLLLNPLTALLPYDLPGLPYRRFLDLVARYDQAMRTLVARKRASGGDDGDVLSMLLQARDEESGAGLSEEEVVGHVGALFAAGHETTANTLTWTLFLLSQHPEVCAGLLDELDQVLGGAAPTVEQLEQLPLLDRVIKESMRVIPVVPGVFRRAAEGGELAGYHVPAHTEIFTSTYFTHHMPELYPEPERFLPSRWETINPSPFEYSPFSVGPRMCIGATFALFEMKIVLAMLLQRYRLELPAGAKVDRFGLITLSPLGGLTMLAHPQDRQFSRGVGGARGSVREMVELPA